MKRWLTLTETFREIARATHPGRKDLLEIRHQGDEQAVSILKDLKVAVQDQGVRLRGCLNGAAPADIDVIDVKDGDIDVLAETLKIYENKSSWRVTRTYASVHCSAEDLHQWLADRKTKPTKRRGARDKADWDAVGLALSDEIRRRGKPDHDNADPAWRLQADVERWVAELLEQRGEPIGESTVRERVRNMLRRAGQAGN